MEREAAQKALAECRERIDGVDRRMLALLNERTGIALEIGRIKKAAGMAIYEPKREDQVYQNIVTSNSGPLSADAVKRVFERIIDEMRKVQRVRMEADEDES